ncbi:cholinesterase-like [Tiliqua scincoides]|uniref:cholinesterase-like n=1 Tax=Tiliqua scincoides TaxID=71010 RepID=UPI003461F6BF
MPGPHFSCFFLVLSILVSNSVSEDDLVVVTSSGPIKGKQLPTSSGTVTAYLGIPYAEPPLGKLRFQKPRPHQPWSHVLEATSFGNTCPQLNLTDIPDSGLRVPNTPLSEDCLFLNVWVPHPRPSTPAPVLVWIYGGGFVTGTASLDIYNGALLAATENVIVASMNYRLGVLGFLYLPPAAPGNMGLWDQHLALKWVKENAAVFGGDPALVTLLGHSAGAASVGFHLLSPASQPLFSRAVLQSGTPNAPWAWKSNAEAKRKSVWVSRQMGCGSNNHSAVVSCLQGKETGDQWLADTAGVFSVTTDGEFLTDEPRKLLETGAIPAKLVLAGITADEGSNTAFFLIPSLRTIDGKMTQRQLLEGVAAFTHREYNEGVAKAIALKYSESNLRPGSLRQALAHFYRDYLFACPLAEMAAKVAEAGSPIYVYSFNQQPAASVWPEWAGAYHGAEIPYLFGNFASLQGTGSLHVEADAALSRRVMRYWANFARNGKPTGSTPSESHWPLYNATEQDVFHISIKEHQIGQISPAPRCEFLTTQFLNATRTYKPGEDSVVLGQKEGRKNETKASPTGLT